MILKSDLVIKGCGFSIKQIIFGFFILEKKIQDEICYSVLTEIPAAL